MMRRLLIVCLVLSNLFSSDANAFIGDYNSEEKSDMAFITSVRQKTDTYKLYDSSAIKLERNVASIGLSKGIGSRFKLYGGLDYILSGEIDSLGYSLDKGYSFVAGANFVFVNQLNTNLSIFSKNRRN